MGNHNCPLFSFIVPSYNSQKTIGYTLKSIFEQDSKLSKEIIVVDSSAYDFLNALQKKYSFQKIYSSKKLMPGIARNIGAEKAKGKILVFVDSDVVLPKNFLEISYKIYHSGKKIFSFPLVVSPIRKNIFSYAEYFFIFSEFLLRSHFDRRKSLATYVFVIEKKIFQKYKFTDMQNSEDYDLSLRMANSGEKLYFCNELNVEHIFQTTLLSLIKKVYSYSQGNAIIRWKYIQKSTKYINRYTIFFLSPFIFLGKFLSISIKNLRYNKIKESLIFLFISPLILFLSFIWTLGFIKKSQIIFKKYNSLDE